MSASSSSCSSASFSSTGPNIDIQNASKETTKAMDALQNMVKEFQGITCELNPFKTISAEKRTTAHALFDKAAPVIENQLYTCAQCLQSYKTTRKPELTLICFDAIQGTVRLISTVTTSILAEQVESARVKLQQPNLQRLTIHKLCEEIYTCGSRFVNIHANFFRCAETLYKQGCDELFSQQIDSLSISSTIAPNPKEIMITVDFRFNTEFFGGLTELVTHTTKELQTIASMTSVAQRIPLTAHYICAMQNIYDLQLEAMACKLLLETLSVKQIATQKAFKEKSLQKIKEASETIAKLFESAFKQCQEQSSTSSLESRKVKEHARECVQQYNKILYPALKYLTALFT